MKSSLNLNENPESDVTESFTSGGFPPSVTSSRTLTVVSVYSKDRMAISGDSRFVSFWPTNTFVSSEKVEKSREKRNNNISGSKVAFCYDKEGKFIVQKY